MTPRQRQQLFDVLMEGMQAAEEIGIARREMEEAVTEELDRIEPVIDEMIVAAFDAGKAFANRKTEIDLVKGTTHVLSL